MDQERGNAFIRSGRNRGANREDNPDTAARIGFWFPPNGSISLSMWWLRPAKTAVPPSRKTARRLKAPKVSAGTK
jgi:hypothetical protein